jgi:hypothetical protein
LLGKCSTTHAPALHTLSLSDLVKLGWVLWSWTLLLQLAIWMELILADKDKSISSHAPVKPWGKTLTLA